MENPERISPCCKQPMYDNTAFYICSGCGKQYVPAEKIEQQLEGFWKEITYPNISYTGEYLPIAENQECSVCHELLYCDWYCLNCGMPQTHPLGATWEDGYRAAIKQITKQFPHLAILRHSENSLK